jgi:AcrR family transcriptional regulator
VADAAPLVRRVDERPLGPKARRTRERILTAAGERFVAAGYAGTSVADVAAAAGVSLGTVYQYFSDRSDLVAALVRQTVSGMRSEGAERWRVEDGIEGLERVIGTFVDFYARSAAFAGVWEEVGHLEPELGDLRRRMGRAFTSVVERELSRAVEAGLADRGVDPAMAARALTGMVDRYCYVTYVFDPPPGGPPDAKASTAQLARLWAGAVGLAG